MGTEASSTKPYYLLYLDELENENKYPTFGLKMSIVLFSFTSNKFNLSVLVGWMQSSFFGFGVSKIFSLSEQLVLKLIKVQSTKQGT